MPSIQRLSVVTPPTPATEFGGDDWGAAMSMKEAQVAKRSEERFEGSNMADEISRPELDARIELIEAKMDARVQRMEMLVEQMSKNVLDIRSDNRDLKKSLTDAKFWAVGTGVVVLLGVWQIVGTNSGNIISAFQAGQGTQTATKPPAQK